MYEIYSILKYLRLAAERSNIPRLPRSEGLYTCSRTPGRVAEVAAVVDRVQGAEEQHQAEEVDEPCHQAGDTQAATNDSRHT